MIALTAQLTINNFLMAFVPVFVAIDVIGGIPMYMTLTQGLTDRAKHTLIIEANFAAGSIALLFIIAGKLIFSLLGITEDDFRIGGGIVLVVLSVTSLLFPDDETHRNPGHAVGVVPMGIPLIMGPAALTSIIMVVDNYGYLLTILSLVANLFIVWITFRQSDCIMRVLGEAGTRAFGKIAWLFMVGIAVMMIRVGIQNILKK